MNLDLHVRDCREVLRELAPQSIDCIVTSPPYNIGTKYKSYRDSVTTNIYLDFLGRVFMELRRVMTDDASLFFNFSAKPSALKLETQVISRALNHFTLQNKIAWVKSITVNETSRGHFKPLAGNRYLNQCHESIYHFTKFGRVELDRRAIGVPFQDKSNIKRRGHDEDRRCRGDVWHIPYQTVRQKKEHPATFPLELPLWAMKLHGVERLSAVLDPFAGIGTTLLAARSLGVPRGIAIEIDPAYASVIAENFSTENLSLITDNGENENDEACL